MGLAAPKKRRKVFHEPENNAWSQSTSRFGEKILHSQGWRPGSFLGPAGAPHASFHTPANASHVRVAAKDDTLGLGATGSSEPASRGPTGLDSLQHLFGRLNGKTEAKLEAEQQNRNDLRRRGYVNRRWGSLHFVSAGLLQKDAAPPNPISKKDFVVIQSSEGDKQELRISDSPDDKSKNEPERCPLRADDQDSKLDQGGAPETKESRKDEKAQRRQERAQRKQARKLRKEEKRRRQHMPSTTAAIVPISTGDAQEVDLVTRRSTARHSAVRSRYIQQKKMAMVDTKALNEILMLRV